MFVQIKFSGHEVSFIRWYNCERFLETVVIHRGVKLQQNIILKICVVSQNPVMLTSDTHKSPYTIFVVFQQFVRKMRTDAIYSVIFIFISFMFMLLFSSCLQSCLDNSCG